MIAPGGTLEGPRGRYLVEGEQGTGGEALALRGRREADGLPVFLKVLPLARRGASSSASSSSFWKALELFEREATVLRALRVDGVPAWIDDFPLGAPEAPAGFVIVTELVPGRTLRAIARAGGLSRVASYRWLDDLLGILEQLHARTPPVVHRDVAPKNVILRPDGRAVLVDFGSVQTVLRASASAQPTSTGTFGYAPPEQFLGRATPASDLYALGMTYLAAASGLEPEQMPLAGARVAVREILTGDARLVRLLEAMTDPDPRTRLGDAGRARAALAPIRAEAGGRGGAAAEGRLAPREAGGLAVVVDAGSDVATDVATDAESYLARLEADLRRAGFVVTKAGELARSALCLAAERRARLGPDLRVYVVRGEALEGGGAGRAVSAPAVGLFARAAGDAHGAAGLLAQLLGAPPVTLAVVVARDGVGPLVPGRIAAGLRRADGGVVVVALVDLLAGRTELVTAPAASGRDPRGLLAWARGLVDLRPG